MEAAGGDAGPAGRAGPGPAGSARQRLGHLHPGRLQPLRDRAPPRGPAGGPAAPARPAGSTPGPRRLRPAPGKQVLRQGAGRQTLFLRLGQRPARARVAGRHRPARRLRARRGPQREPAGIHLAGQAEAERRAALNKLVLSANKDYWEWSLSQQRYELLRRNRDLGLQRFRATRERVRQGDLAPIDSVEALTELQNREAQLAQALGQLRNAALQVSNYLWDENSQPRELPATARAQAL